MRWQVATAFYLAMPTVLIANPAQPNLASHDGGWAVVQGEVGSERIPMDLIVDTAAGASALFPDAVARTKLTQLDQRVMVKGASGLTPSRKYRPAVIVGIDHLNSPLFMIDYPEKTLSLQP
ncbi:MAG: aspartyl protease family protein [Aquidulcibacter sp.]|jgi:hypothetical protein|uniref:aspartyl protease family protein n=1 Tax=Aquidulcibacter sp. TaxID=2052990 RepID=UPI0022C6647F|nr:aspartyl protease family protein [Aquidulcibacter sp.]MCE2891553.1 retropepsin-like domain-containing protein [Hyphomonadaceae bacterium]MCZ8210219.1 aspartyl protease family protein [Aquidulcibacter sp.]